MEFSKNFRSRIKPMPKEKHEVKVNEEEILGEFPPIELTPSDVFHDFEKIFNTEKFNYDVIFKLKDQNIFAHQVILSIRSNYFRKLFSKKNSGKGWCQTFLKFLRILLEISTIVMDDVDYDVFFEIVHACYFPRMTNSNYLKDEKFLEKVQMENEKYHVSLLSEYIVER